jgi:hypothetical protein
MTRITAEAARIDRVNEQARAEHDAWWADEEDTLVYRAEISRSTGKVSVVPITTDGTDAVPAGYVERKVSTPNTEAR